MMREPTERDMVAKYLTSLGWSWIICLSIVGIIVFAGPIIPNIPPEWFSPGRGVALQLIAVGIVFAAAFPTLAKDLTALVGAAGMLAAIFGYIGTLLILHSENPVLLVLALLLTIYPILIAAGILFVALLTRELLGNHRP